MIFAFLVVGFLGAAAAAEPLPVGETGGANGKPLRRDTKSNAVFARAKRCLPFWVEGA